MLLPWQLLWAGCSLAALATGLQDPLEEEDDEGEVVEDLSQYSQEGLAMYKTLFQTRHCKAALEGDNVTTVIEYMGLGPGGKESLVRHTLVSPSRREGMLTVCLGEIRRITFPRKTLVEVYKKVLPNVFEKETNWMDIEVIGINKMTFTRHESGLLLSLLEPVEAAYCNQTVEEGDTLYVDYEGSLEDGTVFDSSAARKAPFGPFVHGKGQIIQGYTEVLTGRCLGERWRMVVPPHLAYGDQGVGEDIPGGATLTFDVRLVQHNNMRWSEEVRGRKVLGWRDVHRPAKCQEISKEDTLYMHYEATREDGQQFGSLADNFPPYGPFSLKNEGKTGVSALDLALPGMCLGGKRMVTVPPRMGWSNNNAHHDTIRVLMYLVSVNGVEVEGMLKGPPKRGETGEL